eukprot:g12215.t1
MGLYSKDEIMRKEQRPEDHFAVAKKTVAAAFDDPSFQRYVYQAYEKTSLFPIFLLCGYWIYYGTVISTYVAFTIPLEAMRFGGQNYQTPFVVLERILYGLCHLSAPVFGKLSDETRSRMGKRRPLLLGGGVLMTASTLALFCASSRLSIGLYLLALTGAMVAKNLVVSVSAGYVADVVPKEHASLVSSVSCVQSAVGCMLGLRTRWDFFIFCREK